MGNRGTLLRCFLTTFDENLLLGRLTSTPNFFSCVQVVAAFLIFVLAYFFMRMWPSIGDSRLLISKHRDAEVVSTHSCTLR